MSDAQGLEFTKMHGAGNDVVILDGIRNSLPEIDSIAAFLLDRRVGVGGDQLVVARPATGADAAFRMEIWNPDGSRAEMCANGIRAFYLWLRESGLSDADEVPIETLKGIVTPRLAGPGLVAVDMGLPILEPEKVPTTLRGSSAGGPALDVAIEAAGESLRASAISIGNPHCVVYVEAVDEVAIGRLGPALENHPAFPNRTNVEFVEIVSPRRLRQRTWERGTGETLACGSGACAVGVASMLLGHCEAGVEIALRGGTLRIEWAGADSHLTMTGPAAHVFRGCVDLGAAPGRSE
jgi:diaminopimelate epimerase